MEYWRQAIKLAPNILILKLKIGYLTTGRVTSDLIGKINQKIPNKFMYLD